MNEETKQAIDCYVEAHRSEIIADLTRLVRIPSVSEPGSSEPEPFGSGCARVLEEAIHMAQEKGMTAENYRNWYGLASYGSGGHCIGIFSHLDVVEADSDWEYPPFEVTEKDGWPIGRGVADDKIAAVIGMHVAKALRELHLGGHTTLQLYLGVCEEKGMSDINRYLQEQKQPDFNMVPDFMFPVSVGEQGVLKLDMISKKPLKSLLTFVGGEQGKRFPLTASAVCRYNAVPTFIPEGIQVKPLEEGLAVQAVGKPASSYHAKDSVSAIHVIADFLAKSELLHPADTNVMRAVAEMTASDCGDYFGIACTDEFFGALACTCKLGALNDSRLVLSFNIRYPKAIDGKTICTQITSYAEAHEFQVENLDDTAPWLFPKDDPRVQILCDCWNEVSGNHDEPRTGGGTYARKLQNAVSYGPKDTRRCPFLPKGHREIHCPDETRHTDTLLNALRVYIRAVCALDEWYAINV